MTSQVVKPLIDCGKTLDLSVSTMNLEQTIQSQASQPQQRFQNMVLTLLSRHDISFNLIYIFLKLCSLDFYIRTK